MGCCSRNNKLLTILETYSRNSHRYMHGHWTSINIVVNLINVSIIVNYTRIVKLLLRQENYQYLMKSRTLLASALIRYWFKANSCHVPCITTLFHVLILWQYNAQVKIDTGRELVLCQWYFFFLSKNIDEIQNFRISGITVKLSYLFNRYTN